MVEEASGSRIDIGMGVLCLSMCRQYARRNLAGLLDELEDFAVPDAFSTFGKVDEGLETRIWFAENGMTVTWDDLARFEEIPKVVLYVLRHIAASNLLLHGLDKAEDFLCRQSMEGTGKTLEASRVGKEWITES